MFYKICEGFNIVLIHFSSLVYNHRHSRKISLRQEMIIIHSVIIKIYIIFVLCLKKTRSRIFSWQTQRSFTKGISSSSNLRPPKGFLKRNFFVELWYVSFYNSKVFFLFLGKIRNNLKNLLVKFAECLTKTQGGDAFG